MSLLNTHESLIDRPLLEYKEVTSVMDDGYHWSGNGAPWPIRETTYGRSGNLLSNLHGSGTDFAETRAYQPGDEPRHINWRATARAGKPMVRIFHEDLAATSCVLIDRRETMRFGTRKRLKVTQAARLAIFLASWEVRRGAELGGLILNEESRWLPPRNGQTGINQLTQLAVAACPPMNHVSKTSLQLSMARMAEQLPGGSHIYLISDFLGLDESFQPLLYQLGKIHRVWALQVFDTAEQELPRAGGVRLIWNHRTNPGAINSNQKSVRKLLHHRFQQHQSLIHQLFADADISFTSIPSDMDQLSDALRG